MKCKNCGMELDEGMTQCPACNEMAEEHIAHPEEIQGVKQKKGMRTWVKAIIASVSMVLVLCLLTCGVLYGLGYRWNDFFPDNDIHIKSNYTVSDSTAAKQANTVVATIGDQKLTNSQLQYQYWTQVQSYLTNYAGSLDDLGLDPTYPLSQQSCYFAEDLTWEQYFILSALDNWQYNATMIKMAEREGYTIPAEAQAELDLLTVEKIDETAQKDGFASYGEKMKPTTGAGATTQGAVDYLMNYYLGNTHFASMYESYLPDEAQLEAYYTANEATLVAQGSGKDAGHTVAVRHILLKPENGTLNEDGRTYTYSEEDWEACRVEAQGVYDEWLAGDANEDTFASFAAAYSADGSASNGGLYSTVTKGQMVEEFDAWCFDEARQVGDHGLVKTVFGYHIMYYSGSAEIWVTAATNAYMQQTIPPVLEEALKTWPAEVDYEAIVIGHVDLVPEE